MPLIPPIFGDWDISSNDISSPTTQDISPSCRHLLDSTVLFSQALICSFWLRSLNILPGFATIIFLSPKLSLFEAYMSPHGQLVPLSFMPPSDLLPSGNTFAHSGGWGFTCCDVLASQTYCHMELLFSMTWIICSVLNSPGSRIQVVGWRYQASHTTQRNRMLSFVYCWHEHRRRLDAPEGSAPGLTVRLWRLSDDIIVAGIFVSGCSTRLFSKLPASSFQGGTF